MHSVSEDDSAFVFKDQAVWLLNSEEEGTAILKSLGPTHQMIQHHILTEDLNPQQDSCENLN